MTEVHIFKYFGVLSVVLLICQFYNFDYYSYMIIRKLTQLIYKNDNQIKHRCKGPEFQKPTTRLKKPKSFFFSSQPRQVSANFQIIMPNTSNSKYLISRGFHFNLQHPDNNHKILEIKSIKVILEYIILLISWWL